jgi:hypothetical protein
MESLGEGTMRMSGQREYTPRYVLGSTSSARHMTREKGSGP